MDRYEHPDSILRGKELIEYIFKNIAIGVIVVIVNLQFSHGKFWAKYVLVALLFGVIIKLFKYLGSRVSESYEDKAIRKKIEKIDELELREFEKLRREDNTSWDEKDFV